MGTNKSFNKKRTSFAKWIVDGKVYLINPSFQLKFISSVLLCVFLSLGVIFISQQYFFHVFIQRGVELGLEQDHVFFALLREQQVEMLQIFVASSLLLSISIGLWAMFYSHRIAGPLYRLHRYFTMASENPCQKLGPLSFRENDFFQELPESINSYLEMKEEEQKAPITPH